MFLTPIIPLTTVNVSVVVVVFITEYDNNPSKRNTGTSVCVLELYRRVNIMISLHNLITMKKCMFWLQYIHII